MEIPLEDRGLLTDNAEEDRQFPKRWRQERGRMMETDRDGKNRRWWTPWLIAAGLFLLPAAYVLSFGPVIWMHKYGWWPHRFRWVYLWLYGPLIHMPMFDWLDRLLDQYFQFWQRL